MFHRHIQNQMKYNMNFGSSGSLDGSTDGQLSSSNETLAGSGEKLFHSTMSLYRVCQFDVHLLGIAYDVNLGGIHSRDSDVQLIDKVEEAQLEGKIRLVPKEVDQVILNISKHGVKVMDQRKRVTKRSSSRNDVAKLMLERRPLQSLALSPPQYKVAPQLLLDSYIEKEIRFAGVVPNIPIDLDATNRTEVLRLIDKGKREEKISWVTSYDHDAIFSLSAQNVKISRRDGKEELLLRLPVHEIAAICYVRDDDLHILAIKFGSFKFSQGTTDDNMDLCQLAVLHCDIASCADELCALIGQCFQLVYTEATMQFLDTKLSEAAAGLSIGSSTIRSDVSGNSTPKKEMDHRNLAFLSQSSLDLEEGIAMGTVSSATSRSLPQLTRRSSTRSESELGSTANELIQDYMKKLHTKLNNEELRRFAQLLRAMHTNLPFSEFCQQVLDLYGPDRKHLLLGMRPFIPEKHYSYFETFLERVGLTSASSISMWKEATVAGGFPTAHRRAPGASATSFPRDDYDRMLNDISNDIENMGSAMDLSGGSDSILPKST